MRDCALGNDTQDAKISQADICSTQAQKESCRAANCFDCRLLLLEGSFRRSNFGERQWRRTRSRSTVKPTDVIVTIEGLSVGASHPVQKAWATVDVPQCGYCQSGQIMSAAALLGLNPKPTDRDIDLAMNGNICRCATYVRIRAAIHGAAKSLEG